VLSGYEVSYREISASDSNEWLTLQVDVRSNNSVTVGSLSLFATYEFRIRTVNSVGASDFSPTFTLYTELGLFMTSCEKRDIRPLY